MVLSAYIMPEKYNFNKDELREVQLCGLRMLLYFDDFCKKHSLIYFLCGGCCIGAIRNGGFIPWDDDVDIFMPRPDYEKLALLWHSDADTERYSYCVADKNMNYRNIFATINDNNTTFIKLHQADLDINHGLVLDILPLDGYPDSCFKRALQVFWALVYSLFCAQVEPANHGIAITLLAKFILAVFRGNNLRYNIWSFAKRQMSKYSIADCQHITELCSGPFYMKKKYPKSAFAKALRVNFEGHSLPIPVGYDDYLRTAFGDYMKLPPKKKQQPHHDVIFCDVHQSYKKYRGKYYCVEGDCEK